MGWQRVIVERGRARARRAGADESGASIEVRSPIVVVAAGTIHTPVLLSRSGIGSQAGQLGRNLSVHSATARRPTLSVPMRGALACASPGRSRPCSPRHWTA